MTTPDLLRTLLDVLLAVPAALLALCVILCGLFAILDPLAHHDVRPPGG